MINPLAQPAAGAARACPDKLARSCHPGSSRPPGPVHPPPSKGTMAQAGPGDVSVSAAQPVIIGLPGHTWCGLLTSVLGIPLTSLSHLSRQALHRAWVSQSGLVGKNNSLSPFPRCRFPHLLSTVMFSEHKWYQDIAGAYVHTYTYACISHTYFPP